MTEALFVSDNTMKIMKYSKYVQVTTLKVWYVLVSYGSFVNLRKLITQAILVFNKTMKISTIQKSIIWSELKYIRVMTLKALLSADFVSLSLKLLHLFPMSI